MNSYVPTLSIRTPEGISFQLLLAGPLPRFLAWCVDCMAILVISILLGRLTLMLTYFDPMIATAFGAVLYFVVTIGYGIFFEWIWRGQTPGKRLFRLRVMDLFGLRLQFSQVAIRNLLRAVDLLPGLYSLGGVFASVSPKCQRLGDIAANTIVIRNPKIVRPEIEDLVGGKYNSLRDFPHLEARLRQTVTPEEAALALETLSRARRLDDTARVRLFDELAAYFQSIVEFPPEATELVSPEQYVRNVVDVIYRTAS